MRLIFLICFHSYNLKMNCHKGLFQLLRLLFSFISHFADAPSWAGMECGLRLARDADVETFLLVGVTKKQLLWILYAAFRLGLVNARKRWFIVVPTNVKVRSTVDCEKYYNCSLR